MTTKHSSAPAAEPTTYNGQQFEAPSRMTRLWATVTLLVTIGLLALGSGIAGAVYVSPLALGAGAIIGPTVIIGEIGMLKCDIGY